MYRGYHPIYILYSYLHSSTINHSFSSDSDPEAALQGRSNGDSFVGTSTQHQKNCNACSGLRLWAIFDRDSYDEVESLLFRANPNLPLRAHQSRRARDPSPLCLP